MNPENHSRRILLAVTGLSPQVVTETLYALAVTREPPFVPTEIHIVTTTEGAERARLELLEGEGGWFHRLREDYGLPPIDFDVGHIHVMRDADGRPLDDNRSREENELAADYITAKVADLAQDERAALHVSLAGGRKTMGYYVGYALSLYGREQDRLSHVLISPRYENNPEFFYPTPYLHRIRTREGDPLDAAKAQVTLAEIPFVRLRSVLTDTMRNKVVRFRETVAAAQRCLEPPEVTISYTDEALIVRGETIHVPAAELAFYGWIARRMKNGFGLPFRPRKSPDDSTERQYAEEYLAEYRLIKINPDRTEGGLVGGMTRRVFDDRKHSVNEALDLALGSMAAPYKIQTYKHMGRSTYGIDLPPERIHWEE